GEIGRRRVVVGDAFAPFVEVLEFNYAGEAHWRAAERRLPGGRGTDHDRDVVGGRKGAVVGGESQDIRAGLRERRRGVHVGGVTEGHRARAAEDGPGRDQRARGGEPI